MSRFVTPSPVPPPAPSPALSRTSRRRRHRALAALAGVAGLATVALLASACSTDSSGSGDPIPVVGAWGRDAAGQPRLEFTEDGRFAGTDGCNRLFGSWEQDGAEVSFGMAGSTMMACEDVDTWLLGLHSGRVDGDVMRISDDTGIEIGTLTRD